MWAASLHAFSRDRPNSCDLVDLAPPSTENFVAAAHRKYDELQRPCGHALLPPQIREELGHFGKGQGGIVHNLPQLGSRREDMSQRPLPLCRVRPRTEPLRRGGI